MTQGTEGGKTSMAAFVGTSLAFVVLFLAAGAPTPLLRFFQREWGYPPQLSTVAFAVYALALLMTLLIFGSLSDHVGRRPVLLVAFSAELLSMLMFMLASNIGVLVAARVVQGLATGAATGALTAWNLELAPLRLKSLASVIAGAGSTAGLALGALLAGVAAQFESDPVEFVFGGLAALMGACLVVFMLSPETVTPTRGALASLRPRVAVPSSLTLVFVGLVPIQVAGWMYSALFIGLTPTIVPEIFHIESALVTGAVAFVAPASAAVASVVMRRVVPLRATTFAAGMIIVGACLLLGGMLSGYLWLFVLGGGIGGYGFGTGFSGGLRSLLTGARPQERAGVTAALFVVAYLAFGVPAVIAGELIGPLGPLVVVVGYVVVIGAAAALTLVDGLRRRAQRQVL